LVIYGDCIIVPIMFINEFVGLWIEHGVRANDRSFGAFDFNKVGWEFAFFVVKVNSVTDIGVDHTEHFLIICNQASEFHRH